MARTIGQIADQAGVGAYPKTSISRWRLYRSQQSAVYPSTALVHEVVETTSGTPTTGLVLSWVDLGNVPTTAGAPLTSSITLTPSPAMTVPTNFLAESVGINSVSNTATGNVVVNVASNWGVTSQGNAYHDPAGAVAGEEAVAFYDLNGNLVVSKITR